MTLNEYGKIADECWRAIPEHFPNVELGAHVIMPNHVHGIIVIINDRRGAVILRPYDGNENHHKSTSNQVVGSDCAFIQVRRFVPPQ